MAIEVEIKKSKADLLREFDDKKAKHFAYANADRGGSAPFVPNYLYFYVPAELGEVAVKVIEEQCPKAGVAIQTDTRHMDGKNTAVVRKPTKLREAPPRPEFLRAAIMRMSSELCGRAIIADETITQVQYALEQLNKTALEIAQRAAGSLDCEDVDGDLRRRAGELAFAVESIQDFNTLPEEQQQKWLQAARRYLEAQYLNSEEWRLASICF
jgi:hypothetical protein